MILETVVVGAYQVNCYILAEKEGSQAIIIDPGEDYDRIKKVIDKYKLIPKIIINTHGHIDHIGANDKFGLPVYIHKDDADCISDSKRNMSAFLGSPASFNSKIKTLNDKDRIELGKISLEVIHTPGHTPGSVCLKFDDTVFTGDTLFYEGIGRTDFPYSDSEKMAQSIKKLMDLPDKIKILPGHGQASSIGGERKTNHFI